MKALKETVLYDQIIKKSSFICTLTPVSSVNEAEVFLKAVRTKHSDATHNCYSYIIGDSGEIAKSSDDGEPSQTAGVVIYEVLKKNDLTNVLAIVTRYYGGIKLGAGGLIRAYGSSVSGAIKIADLVEIINYKTLVITTDYPYLNSVLKLIDTYELTEKEFSSKVILKVSIPVDEITDISAKLIENTQNNIKIEISED